MQPFRNSSRSPLRASVGLLAAAVLLSACASSPEDESAAAEPDEEAEVEPATEEDDPGGDDDAGLIEAREIVEHYLERPTQIPNSTPIDAPIPEGKEIVFVSCGTSTCDLEAAIIEEAADALNWTLTTINTDGTPEQVKSAWQQIIRTEPDGVLYPATPREVFDPELRQAEELGIAVAACCTTDPAEDGIDFVIGTPEQTAEVGRIMAAWVIDDSDGEAESVYVDISAFPILHTLREFYDSTMDELCPSCEVGYLDVPITALGVDVTDRIVSYLRANPDTKYVTLSVDVLGTGLPSALRAAGLDDVRVMGEGPDHTTLQYIADGDREATAAFPYYEEMFSMVDALARIFADVPVEHDVHVPNWIITADNMPTSEEIFPLVEDVREQYFELWGVN